MAKIIITIEPMRGARFKMGDPVFVKDAGPGVIVSTTHWSNPETYTYRIKLDEGRSSDNYLDESLLLPMSADGMNVILSQS